MVIPSKWVHLTEREKRYVKVLLILKHVAWAGLMFSAGAVYAYLRCGGFL